MNRVLCTVIIYSKYFTFQNNLCTWSHYVVFIIGPSMPFLDVYFLNICFPLIPLYRLTVLFTLYMPSNDVRSGRHLLTVAIVIFQANRGTLLSFDRWATVFGSSVPDDIPRSFLIPRRHPCPGNELWRCPLCFLSILHRPATVRLMSLFIIFSIRVNFI